MSRLKLLFGLCVCTLIVAALITAGCTGTKTMVGNEGTLPSAGQSARSDYLKYSGELKDEIGFIQNHYKLSENATLEEYQAWLNGLGEKIALCRQMYDNTSSAAQKYLTYLNASGTEYRNVTSDDAIFRSDLEALNQTYVQHANYLNTSVKKMAALQEYRDEINASAVVYNGLMDYAKGAKVTDVDSYSRFIDGFYDKSSAFERSVDNTVKAGQEYQKYCEPGSAEYKAVDDNNNALEGNVAKCWDAYKGYKKDYDSKINVKSQAQSVFREYVDDMGTVSATKKSLDDYRGTAKALNKLDKGWLDGYKQKIDAFDSACNEAIASGDECKKYLDPASSDYKSVTDNEKNMKSAKSTYDDNYKKLESTYRNLHPLGSIMN